MAGYSAAQEIAEHYKDSPTTSNGWYRIPCPAHHGVGNNLALKDGDYGGLLVTCHSVGCSRKDIFQAFKDAGLAVKQEWTYPNGKHVKRIDTAEGKMVYGEGSTKGVPILIGEDSPGNLVVITEGEDDYNAIISADLRAVTAACYVGGSNAAKSADYSALKGRAVAVWPDHDKQGLAGAASAALACLEAGASSVDIIPPTGQPDSGSGAADLTLEAIPVWICNRRPWTPAPGRQHFTPTPLSDILQLPPTNWVVEGLIAEDSTNILIGRPKTGKTVWMLSLLKAMSTGGQFLGFDVPQGHSWLFTEQNRQSFQSQLRMTKIQGDDLITPYLRLNIEPGLTPDQFADHLYSDFMAATVKPTLIVIDTIGAFILIDDFNDYGKVRVAMNPLILMAQRVGQYCGTATLFLHHARKGEGDGSEAVLASTIFSGIVDNILCLSNAQGSGRRKLRIRGRHGTGLLPEECDIVLENGEYSLASTGEELLEDVLAVVEAGAATTTEIQAALKKAGVTIGKTALRDVIGALVAAGRLAKLGSGRSTSYALNQSQIINRSAIDS